MLDVNLFRAGDGKPDLVRDSQRRRFADAGLVDEIAALDDTWRRRQFDLDRARQERNATAKKIGELRANSQEHAARQLMEGADEAKKRLAVAALEAEAREAKAALDAKLLAMPNILHASVPVAADEENNVTLRALGEMRTEENLMDHVDLCTRLDIVDLKKGSAVAGGRGYFLKNEGAQLNRALINFGLDFLRRRGFQEMQTPFFMTRESMARCAQLAQYDEELYKLDGEDKFLIATSEQPLCAYHQGERIHPSQLPIRYAGYSTCFRKEAGSHGRDTAGIFRVHQFEKVEQFCITTPDGDASWEMHEEMIRNAEDFYTELGVACRVVNVVSGALNDAAAKKYDLEGWFPASRTYRELVSCSNCTDYQARRLGITYGQKMQDKRAKKYVHTLNSTLTATERTLCCILETYQREDGVEVPKVLQPYMGGIEFIPFKKSADGKRAARPKSKSK